MASFHFARRYFGNRKIFFLFLRLLRCFSSPGSLCIVMYWLYSDWSLSSRVSPFRYSRIKGYLLLPVTFRSLSRLSSALSAKASTMRSLLLDHCHFFLAWKSWGLAMISHRLSCNFSYIVTFVTRDIFQSQIFHRFTKSVSYPGLFSRMS